MSFCNLRHLPQNNILTRLLTNFFTLIGTVSRWDHFYWASPIYIFCLKIITYNIKVITYNFNIINFYSLRIITYNLKTIELNAKKNWRNELLYGPVSWWDGLIQDELFLMVLEFIKLIPLSYINCDFLKLIN